MLCWHMLCRPQHCPLIPETQLWRHCDLPDASCMQSPGQVLMASSGGMPFIIHLSDCMMPCQSNQVCAQRLCMLRGRERGINGNLLGGASPVRMVDRASSTPLQRPPVKGRDPYLKTIGFPRAFVSSNGAPFAVALHSRQHPARTLQPALRRCHSICIPM